MQLSPSSGSIDDAIEELKLVLPVVAMTNIVARRRKQHKDVKPYDRVLRHWRARQLIAECDID
jgi:hypothetical protein